MHTAVLHLLSTTKKQKRQIRCIWWHSEAAVKLLSRFGRGRRTEVLSDCVRRPEFKKASLWTQDPRIAPLERAVSVHSSGVLKSLYLDIAASSDLLCANTWVIHLTNPSTESPSICLSVCLSVYLIYLFIFNRND